MYVIAVNYNMPITNDDLTINPKYLEDIKNLNFS